VLAKTIGYIFSFSAYFWLFIIGPSCCVKKKTSCRWGQTQPQAGKKKKHTDHFLIRLYATGYHRRPRPRRPNGRQLMQN
jgi:hypothetical protein